MHMSKPVSSMVFGEGPLRGSLMVMVEPRDGISALSRRNEMGELVPSLLSALGGYGSGRATCKPANRLSSDTGLPGP